MQIKPIIAALRKHRLATVLIALEIALACAVLCNACFLIANRLHAMHIPSGIDENALAIIQLDGYDENQAVDLNARVLSSLRGVPGVESVSVLNAVPFGQHAGTAGITLKPRSHDRAAVIHFYIGGPGAFKALGLQVVAGPKPQSADYRPVQHFVPDDARVWVTRSLAEHLWPHAKAVGRNFWTGTFHFRVAGVLDKLVRPYPGAFGGPQASQWSAFVPGLPGAHLAGSYLLRARPGQLQEVLVQARGAAAKAAPDAVLDTGNSKTLPELRHEYFRSDRTMTNLLIGVIVALLGITAFGIVGLASFWVAQRRKQIGVRRALGATRGDILHYFQTENFLIVTFGIVLGLVLAYALNLLLMSQYELPRLPLWYLAVGAVVLWLLGQLAVLAPALRASNVPPVVATRSV